MLDNFRDSGLGKKILQKLMPLAEEVTGRLGRPATLMEVCGTHTMNIARSGLKSILADYVELRSGPGCPVCVTDQTDIDKIIALAGTPEVVIATFGDMIRVPGTNSSLEQERARNALVKVFYSPEEAVDFAAGHPKKEVVFLGVGFETTAPAIALSIAAAKNKGLKNYSVFSVHKLVPPVMKVLLNDHELRIDGFILPGHVSAITGRKAFDFIASEYNIPAVITGFETVDIIESVYLLLKQILDGKAQTINGYTRLVREEGNIKARELTAEFFEPSDVLWRGFGMVSQSGLALRKDYSLYNAVERFPVEASESSLPRGCSCGDILRGKKTPSECPLFTRLCTPFYPVGPCMVSSEGACAACYQYEYSS